MEQNPFSSFETPDSALEANEKKEGKKSTKKPSSGWIERIKQERAKNREKTDAATAGEKHDKESEQPSTKELAKAFLQERAAKIEADLELASPAEEPALSADLAFIEAVNEKIDDPSAEVDEAVEEAYQELMAEIEELYEQSTDNMVEDDDSRQGATRGTHTATPAASTTSNPPTKKASATPPPAPFSSPPPISSTAAPLPPPFSPNIAQLNHNQAPSEDHRRRTVRVLATGAIGNAVTHRDEKKQTKEAPASATAHPEAALSALEKQVHEKEVTIEQIVHERKETTVQAPGNSYHADERHEFKGETTVPIHPVERETDIPGTPEQESTVNESAPRKESALGTTQEAQLPRTKAQKPPERQEDPRLETLSTPQLLSIAEKIVVLDTTVKKLYQTNQINRKGLEAIVKAHLKHRDIGKELDKHLLGREAMHERAREFKHDPPADTTDDSNENTQHSQHKKNSLSSADIRKNIPSLLAESDEHTAHQPTQNQLEEANADKTTDKFHPSTAAVIAILLALFALWVLFSLR